MRDAGLWHVSQIPYYEIDRVLVSAFVERWRPETHTFHLPFGECTITLQDVAFQLGLHIEGDPVSGCMSSWEHFEGNDIFSLCQELLGVVPGPEYRWGYFVDCNWFKDTFRLSESATQDEIVRHTRAYMMLLFGGLLFPDKSGFRVHLKWLPLLRDFRHVRSLSWGSAVLAMLQQYLCRAVNNQTVDIAGCITLLQSWIWYRLPQFSPAGSHEFKFPLAAR